MVTEIGNSQHSFSQTICTDILKLVKEIFGVHLSGFITWLVLALWLRSHTGQSDVKRCFSFPLFWTAGLGLQLSNRNRCICLDNKWASGPGRLIGRTFEISGTLARGSSTSIWVSVVRATHLLTKWTLRGPVNKHSQGAVCWPSEGRPPFWNTKWPLWLREK